jgi:hypothetical protein
MLIKADICGAIKVIGGTEFMCYLKPHAQLQSVKPGDTARIIKARWDNHNFQDRYPYRKKE